MELTVLYFILSRSRAVPPQPSSSYPVTLILSTCHTRPQYDYYCWCVWILCNLVIKRILLLRLHNTNLSVKLFSWPQLSALCMTHFHPSQYVFACIFSTFTASLKPDRNTWQKYVCKGMVYFPSSDIHIDWKCLKKRCLLSHHMTQTRDSQSTEPASFVCLCWPKFLIHVNFLLTHL